MTITEHKKLTAEIPDDLRDGEEIEVSDGMGWYRSVFYSYEGSKIYAKNPFHVGQDCKTSFAYARRPATALKRLRDEPWNYPSMFQYRTVTSTGQGWVVENKPFINSQNQWESCGRCDLVGEGYDPTDWQNSLEQRPTAHQQHMARLDAGIKSAEAGIKRNLEQRRQIPGQPCGVEEAE